MKELTPMKSIRGKCLSCANNDIAKIRFCDVFDCSLHPYRFGKRGKLIKEFDEVFRDWKMKQRGVKNDTDESIE